MIIDKKRLDIYKHNIETRRWIPWEEYLKLKVGDKIELPYYEYGANEPSGKNIYTIKELTRGYSDGVEHGNYSAEVTRKFFNGKKEHLYSGGTLSVNLDGVNCEEEICPPDEIIQKIIDLHFKACDELYFLTKDTKYDHRYVDTEGFKIDYIKRHWND